MTYAQQWLRAIALKEPTRYLGETGADENATSTTSSTTPPSFTVEDLGPAILEEKRKAERRALWWGMGIGAIVAILIDRLVLHRRQ